MKRLILLLAAISMVSGPFAHTAFAQDQGLEQALVDGASTAQQHEALARYYEGKAAAARKEAENHHAMAKSYGGAKASQMAEMKSHCEKLAALDEDEAKEFDAMAKAHRGLAK